MANGNGKEPFDPKVEHIRNEDRPANLSQPLPQKALPKDIQRVLDDDETLWETIYEGEYVNSTLTA